MSEPAGQVGTDPARRVFRWVGIVHGLILVAASIASGALSWFTLGRLRVIDDRGDIEIGADIQAWIESPQRTLLLTVPALVCGVMMVVTRRLKWLWFVVGMAFLLLLVALVLYLWLSVIGPYYEPREL